MKLHIPMVIVIKDKSKIIRDMDWALWYINNLMNIILATDFTTKNMAGVLFNIRMVRNILVSSATTISMDMASLLINLAIYMRENYNIII